jgi:hypothetical protein
MASDTAQYRKINNSYNFASAVNHIVEAAHHLGWCLTL